MDLKEIRKIVELMEEHGLTHFKFEKEDFSISLKKGMDIDEVQKALSAVASSATPLSPPVSAAAPLVAPVDSAESSAATPQTEGSPVSAPMVGTFYRASSPDSPAFVEVGSTVSKGQTLCIIEAMKVMNEIAAEKSGKIAAIHIEDGSSVQYGDDLMHIV